jgi:hypothetical protein
MYTAVIPSELAEVATFMACVLEIPVSNLGWGTTVCPDEYFPLKFTM